MANSNTPEPKSEGPIRNFLEEIIERDLEQNTHEGRVLTRFPPEPNGYLHIGHAKSICINFGLAKKYGGKTNLRFDDTNPTKEDVEYVDSIKEDIEWLGFEWSQELYASDYFEQLYAWAEQLVERGLAYVDDQPQEELRRTRGTISEPGINSPRRDTPPAENLALFRRMRAGEFPDGSMVLRAKIDMAHPNMLMRDPILYRILHAEHHRTGDKWCIYPMYDFAHGQCDSIETITHSICTLEFDVHRPLYDWFIETLGIFPSHQYEFARLNLTYTVMSKRRLLELVQNGIVEGWDDPRMPTICGLRRRGYTPESIRNFADAVGVAKRDNVIDVALLEFYAREHLNRIAQRRMGVEKPLRMVIESYPEGEEEWLEAVNNPENAEDGKRTVPFTRELWIEATDFMMNPPKKFHRLTVGAEVRLRYAYLVTCTRVELGPDGEPATVYCTHDAASRGGNAPDGRKVLGTIHWVSQRHAVPVKVRLFDRLFKTPDPNVFEEGGSWRDNLNPDSLRVATFQCEPSLKELGAGTPIQLERIGYFCQDSSSTPEELVLNRTATLKDGWKPTK